MFDDAWAWLEAISWWKVGIWLITTLGIAGTLALLAFLAVAYPLVLKGILSAVARFFSWVFSYRIGCAIVAAVAAAFIADYHRHSIDDAEFAQRTALFEHAQKQRDERIKTETREEVWTDIANATAANVVLDKDVKEFTDAPPPPLPTTGDPYNIAPADRVRLCRIAGKTECEPRGTRRMQAPRRPAPHPADRKLSTSGARGAG